MTDEVFEASENLLLAKRPSAIRERQIRQLEFRALVEEVEDPREEYPAPKPGSDAYWALFGQAS